MVFSIQNNFPFTPTWYFQFRTISHLPQRGIYISEQFLIYPNMVFSIQSDFGSGARPNSFYKHYFLLLCFPAIDRGVCALSENSDNFAG
jgi:hypothetical protein